MFSEDGLFSSDIINKSKYVNINLSTLPISEIIENHDNWIHGKSKGVRLVAVGCSTTNLLLPTNVSIDNAVFINCSFYDSTFNGNINNSCFSGCVFINCVFSDNSVLLSENRFINTEFSNVTFYECSIINNLFNSCIFNRIQVNNVNINGNEFRGVCAEHIELNSSNIYTSSLHYSKIKVSNLDKCTIFETKTCGCEIENIYMFSSSVLSYISENDKFDEVTIERSSLNDNSISCGLFRRLTIHGGSISDSLIKHSEVIKHVITAKISKCRFLYCIFSKNQGLSGSIITDCEFIVIGIESADTLTSTTKEKNSVIFLQ